MSATCMDLFVESLVSRAHDIDRFIALYRAELARIPVETPEGAAPVQTDLEELEDLVLIVEELWESVSARTARLHEEMQSRMLAEEVDQELARQGEKWHRYLNFAAVAGIRVPAPVN